ncbi:hypothetical protein OESDEN_13197, partial [Oesophagostomum dentatum]
MHQIDLGINNLPNTNPNLANKIRQFNSVYDTLANSPAEKQFIDKLFDYVRQDRGNPAQTAQTWARLQQDFTNLSSTACNTLTSKFPALSRL